MMKMLLMCSQIGILLILAGECSASGFSSTSAANPCLSFAIQPQESDTAIFADLLFASGSASLNEKARIQLDRILSVLKRFPELELNLEGHADHIGTEENNLRLSRARVEACRLYLTERGIFAERLTSGAYGETRPKADNSSRRGRKTNRRVECFPIRR